MPFLQAWCMFSLYGSKLGKYDENELIVLPFLTYCQIFKTKHNHTILYNGA